MAIFIQFYLLIIHTKLTIGGNAQNILAIEHKLKAKVFKSDELGIILTDELGTPGYAVMLLSCSYY